jgi:23S rRNA pseudouridine1911/1915/1917 synthase
MTEVREFVVPPEAAGERLDIFLARQMPGWSRSQIQRQIRMGMVNLGSATVYKAGEKLVAGDAVTLRAARHELRATPEDIALDIVYEDDDLVVVNKPAGMTVHVGAGVRSGTLVNALLHHIGALARRGGDLRPGIVHRLDRMTSGLMVVAKTDFALEKLSEQFKARTVHKNYLALVHGKLAGETGEIAKPVGRDPRRRVKMRPGGIRAREAVTRYRAMRGFEGFTLLECHPLTGRTHQIRVHLSSIGHPVVGDTLYGAPSHLRIGGKEQKTLPRHFLHAAALEFVQPRTGEALRFEAPLPPDLSQFLALLQHV